VTLEINQLILRYDSKNAEAMEKEMIRRTANIIVDFLQRKFLSIQDLV
jgi:hypothetical protein